MAHGAPGRPAGGLDGDGQRARAKCRDQRVRVLQRFEDQVLDFLFERNALLAAQEAKAHARAKS
ncbi:hypothetical protein DB30_05477 [Enhygromyxa salina]|uniref:Uncharacterized protein n=1 Tax=Enhygromyxa salina TaxID=215803 RepID=A0A0C1ZX12_9BACT|nr:hypothetical protein DB30_05477 [Enhygromyxa salina]